MGWLDDFKREDNDGPPDGEHVAYLERAVIRDTNNGTAIKCEWRSTDMELWWESWHNTTGGGKGLTQQFIGALGINLAEITSEDQLADALMDREDVAWVVKTSHSKDGRWLNTNVVERAKNVQEALAVTTSRSEQRAAREAEVPIDTTDFVERGAAPSGTSDLFGDDDIPF